MIKSSFIIIPGIGELTEKNLWRKGILEWQDLREEIHTISSSKTKKRIVDDYLEKANKAVHERDASFFAKYLPPKEFWRLYKEFYDKTLFLDIETTGLSLYYDKITLIGTFDGNRIKFFVRDHNLPEIIDYIKNFQLIVTYNGKLFDIPFIKKEFPEIQIPAAHIDLRYLLRSVGIRGPLKTVERKLHMKRTNEVQDITGREAAVLWSRFVKGDDSSLERLLLYNIYDTVNLQSILHFCYQKKFEVVESEMNVGPYQLKLQRSREVKRRDYYPPAPKCGIPKVKTRRSDNGLLEILLDSGDVVLRVRRERIKKTFPRVGDLIQKIQEIKGLKYTPVSVGIDLSGSEQKASGFCVLKGKEAHLDLVKTDDEIINKTLSARPTIVSIDSPLSLPKGRCCVDDSCNCRMYGITRECERILRGRGVNVYPCLIKSMQKLTNRGMKLAKLLENQDCEVIESYPGAAQDILGFPRKRVDLRELEIDLMNLGISPYSNGTMIVHDEIDALTSALVGYFYLAKEYEAIGNIEEGYLIVPAINKSGG